MSSAPSGVRAGIVYSTMPATVKSLVSAPGWPRASTSPTSIPSRVANEAGTSTAPPLRRSA
jgi:hypothetical protein